MKLQVRHVLGDINYATDPAGLIVSAVGVTLRELAKAGPAWDTLRITVALDDETFTDCHVVTATALEA